MNDRLNVNEYAETVLYSEDLNEKLRLAAESSVIDFSFQQPDISTSSLEPGRPDSLLMEKSGDSPQRISLPSRPSLVDDKNRGILLHFFANHELLAAELMALALLKFPDAPEDFRRGLFQTLREEQKHTLWYLGRMKECGVELGEFPVSRFFWDTVSPMESPFDYVSRLSLTFEQANLDYSRHFAAIMKEAGDERTARILEKIYHDEIKHVGYGLKWFRHWKTAGQSDWEAYRKCLSLPLSPSRAKGNGTGFNDAGRLEAGLDPDFVRKLSVFEKSKGRTPNVFYFNPDAEDLIVHCTQQCTVQCTEGDGTVYRPSPKVTALIRDLEILLLFLSRQDDVILLRKPPSLRHLERLKDAGFQLPEFSRLEPDGTLPENTSLRERKVNAIIPWSMSPTLPRIFESLASPDQTLWRNDWPKLFSKTEQARVFAEWMAGAKACADESEIDAALEELDPEIVVKAPVSAAGRGVKFFRDKESASRQARTFLEEFGSVLIEPRHRRELDFSVQFEVSSENQSITRLGLIRQLIDPKNGRYRGSISSPKFCKGLPGEQARFLMEEALSFYDESGPLPKAILEWAIKHHYSGPLGIDAYLFRNEDDQLAARTVCEINPRFTMGRVAHEMRKNIAPGHSVKLELTKNSPELMKPGENQPRIDEKSGKLSAGSLFLNELDTESQFAAIITVDRNPQNL